MLLWTFLGICFQLTKCLPHQLVWSHLITAQFRYLKAWLIGVSIAAGRGSLIGPQNLWCSGGSIGWSRIGNQLLDLGLENRFPCLSNHHDSLSIAEAFKRHPIGHVVFTLVLHNTWNSTSLTEKSRTSTDVSLSEVVTITKLCNVKGNPWNGLSLSAIFQILNFSASSFKLGSDCFAFHCLLCWGVLYFCCSLICKFH